MLRFFPFRFHHYAIAGIAVSSTIALTLLLQSILISPYLALFYGAVAVSAWYHNLKSALLVTVLSCSAITYFSIPPTYSRSVGALEELLPVGVFALVTLLIGSLWLGWRTAKRQTDMPEKRQVEEALQITDSRIANILESITDAFVAFDRQWRYTYVNAEAARMLQRSPEELLGKHVWQEVFPEYAQVNAIAYQELHRAVAEQVSVKFENFSLAANRWLEVSAFPFPDGLAVYFRDISDRKRAERRLAAQHAVTRILAETATLADAVPTILQSLCESLEWPLGTIWSVDRQAHVLRCINSWHAPDLDLEEFVEVNQHTTFALNMGLAGRIWASGQPAWISDLTKDNNFPRAAFAAKAGLRGAFGFPILLKNEILGIIECFSDRVQAPDEDLLQMMAAIGSQIGQFIERKRVELEREQLLERERAAREEAEAANRIKDKFLAVLSHELRSPLNPILGWTKLLRSRSLNEEVTDRALETIERNAKIQTQLIDDLLDVSRILQGKMVLNVCSVNLEDIIEAALETVQFAAKAKDIQLQTVLAGDVGQIAGDPVRLQQVVWNLLSNAVKFTHPTGRVVVRLERVGSYAQIQVKDTGQGISPDFLPYIFDYFRQADNTTTRKFGGLGLGLAIVRNLIELHGGSIEAESPGEGLGSTFTVRLPLLKNEDGRMKDKNLFHPSLHVNGKTNYVSHPLLKGLQVLVVDDEADIREWVSFVLKPYFVEVRVAASAKEALAVLDQSKPDVLISDIGMPDVDGYMLIRQVRNRLPEQGGKIPAIALTAYAKEYNQQQALAAGFQLHIPKPVEPEELVMAITRLARESEQAGNSSLLNRCC